MGAGSPPPGKEGLHPGSLCCFPRSEALGIQDHCPGEGLGGCLSAFPSPDGYSQSGQVRDPVSWRQQGPRELPPKAPLAENSPRSKGPGRREPDCSPVTCGERGLAWSRASQATVSSHGLGDI